MSRFTRDELSAMPIRRLRNLDIRDGDEEKLVQEIVDAKLAKMPPERTVYRKDVPDIKNAEEEAKWQKVIDERTAKAKGKMISDPDDIMRPIGDVISPAPDEIPDETPDEEPEESEQLEPDYDQDATEKDPEPEEEIIEPMENDEDATDVSQQTAKDAVTPWCDSCDSKGGRHKKTCPKYVAIK